MTLHTQTRSIPEPFTRSSIASIHRSRSLAQWSAMAMTAVGSAAWLHIDRPDGVLPAAFAGLVALGTVGAGFIYGDRLINEASRGRRGGSTERAAIAALPLITLGLAAYAAATDPILGRWLALAILSTASAIMLAVELHSLRQLAWSQVREVTR